MAQKIEPVKCRYPSCKLKWHARCIVLDYLRLIGAAVEFIDNHGYSAGSWTFQESMTDRTITFAEFLESIRWIKAGDLVIMDTGYGPDYVLIHMVVPAKDVWKLNMRLIENRVSLRGFILGEHLRK